MDCIKQSYAGVSPPSLSHFSPSTPFDSAFFVSSSFCFLLLFLFVSSSFSSSVSVSFSSSFSVFCQEGGDRNIRRLRRLRRRQKQKKLLLSPPPSPPLTLSFPPSPSLSPSPLPSPLFPTVSISGFVSLWGFINRIEVYSEFILRLFSCPITVSAPMTTKKR